MRLAFAGRRRGHRHTAVAGALCVEKEDSGAGWRDFLQKTVTLRTITVRGARAGNGGARVKRETGVTPVQSRCCVSFLSCGPEQRELATVFSPMKGENAGRRSGEGRVRRPAVSCGTTGGMQPSRKGRCRKCEIHLFFLTELPKPGRMPGGSRHGGKIRPGYPF